MLSRIKLDLPNIRKAIIDLDDDKLSVDNLKLIKRQLPSSEEIARLKGVSDISRLAKADRFFYQASSSHSHYINVLMTPKTDHEYTEIG